MNNALLLTCGLLLTTAALAGENGTATRKGPLAKLPSRPGAHVAKIKAMGENSWLELGAPKPDPKWGLARGRSWSAPMPYAPKLGGAFLFGNGPHGGMFKPDRYGDELFFYDAGAHAWVCAYPGFEIARYKDVKINKDGFESLDGKPLPIAPMVHTWSQVTYDTHRQEFMCMPAENRAYSGNRLKTRNAFLKKNKDKINRKNAGPWIWNASTAAWGRARTRNPIGGRVYYGLMYVPSLKKTWCYWRYGKTAMVRYYDPVTKNWATVKPKGPTPPFGIDYTLCMDTSRNRVYMGGGAYPVAKAGTNALWIYDFATNTFIDPKPKGQPGKSGNNYGTQAALMHYDAAADAVVLFRHGKRSGNPGVFVYDIAKNAWATAPTRLPEWPGNTRSGFYHPGWNAHVIHSAHDGRTNGKIYVYRYKRRKKEARK